MIAWQLDRELGEKSRIAFRADGAAVLLGDDVVGDRQPQAGAFAGRFGRKERLEQLVLDVRRDTGAIVPDPDLHHFAEIGGVHLQDWAERSLAITLVSRIEAVGEKVEEYAGQLLRCHFNWRQ